MTLHLPTSTSSFSAGDVIATAFASATGFHYTLSVMKDAAVCIKYHATEPSRGYFVFDAKPQTLVTSHTFCVGLKIGNIGETTEERITELLRSIPMVLPECDRAADVCYRCRVWLKQAIRVLDNEGLISCLDADAVVNGELRKYAEENGDHIRGGTGGYKVYVSEICS